MAVLSDGTTVAERVSEDWNYSVDSLDTSTSVVRQITEDWNYTVDELVVDETLTEAEDTATYVYENGDPVVINDHGDTDLVHIGGTPLKNTGGSQLVFEAGVGIDTGTAGAGKIEATEAWNYSVDSLDTSTSVAQQTIEGWNAE